MFALLTLSAVSVGCAQTARQSRRPRTRWQLLNATSAGPTITLDTRSVNKDAFGRTIGLVSFAYLARTPDYPHVLFHQVLDCSHQMGLLGFADYDPESASSNTERLDKVSWFAVVPGSESEVIYRARSTQHAREQKGVN